MTFGQNARSAAANAFAQPACARPFAPVFACESMVRRQCIVVRHLEHAT
jgi:hypothetical protein